LEILLGAFGWWMNRKLAELAVTKAKAVITTATTLNNFFMESPPLYYDFTLIPLF
jgi:hypothetical protein